MSYEDELGAEKLKIAAGALLASVYKNRPNLYLAMDPGMVVAPVFSQFCEELAEAGCDKETAIGIISRSVVIGIYLMERFGAGDVLAYMEDSASKAKGMLDELDSGEGQAT